MARLCLNIRFIAAPRSKTAWWCAVVFRLQKAIQMVLDAAGVPRGAEAEHKDNNRSARNLLSKIDHYRDF